jgi:hypothetical protein
LKFEIVDKAEEGAGAFGAKVISSFRDDFGTRKTFESGTYHRPRIAGRHCQCECRNRVRRIIGIA